VSNSGAVGDSHRFPGVCGSFYSQAGPISPYGAGNEWKGLCAAVQRRGIVPKNPPLTANSGKNAASVGKNVPFVGKNVPFVGKNGPDSCPKALRGNQPTPPQSG
jgi:hypothetical protein